MNKTREQSLELVTKWVTSESLRKHLLAVETSVRAYARRYGADEELWGTTGLLHDFDYERYPTQEGHPFEGVKVLREMSYPEEMLDAILGHALYSGVPRRTQLAKVLFACDELSGFVVACAYVRPDKLETLTAESVIKKLKKKDFAEKVSRDDIELGVQELGIPKEEHIEFVIGALRENAAALGLQNSV